MHQWYLFLADTNTDFNKQLLADSDTDIGQFHKAGIKKLKNDRFTPSRIGSWMFLFLHSSVSLAYYNKVYRFL